jgi:hypothetical protein
MDKNPMFDDVLFIEEISKTPVMDFKQTPFLCNMHGRPALFKTEEGYTPIKVLPEDPDLDLGEKYRNIGAYPKRVPAGYEITEFDFRAKEVRYAALPATEQTVRAFGMTLLRNGHCVNMNNDGLVPPGCALICAKYMYGKWAGHWSPYQSPPGTRPLITINPTDLEYHDFPHVFFSMGDVPLVISVARWRPYVNEIALADLWVAPGDAIILPPKRFPTNPGENASPADAWRKVVDLHGNRNSALATWSDITRLGLTTQTILLDPAPGIHYHEEITPTVHSLVSP